MQCLHPIGLSDRKYLVPCGRCAACLQRKRQDWVIRLKEELKVSENAFFVTITYNDRYIPLADEIPTLCKPDVQKYLKRLRKRLKKGLKYYLVGEYGTKTQRPHYHAIMFNVITNGRMTPKDAIIDAWKIIREDGKRDEIGNVDIGSVTGASMSYTAKYILQTWRKYPEKERPFSLMSKGLGKSYIDVNKSYHIDNIENMHYVGEGGTKSALPRYFRDKLYDKHEKKVHELHCRSTAHKNWMEKQERFEKKYSEKRFYENSLEANTAFEKQMKKIQKKGEL